MPIDIEEFRALLAAKRAEFESPCPSSKKAADLIKKIREFREKVWNDPNAVVKPRTKPGNIFNEY